MSYSSLALTAVEFEKNQKLLLSTGRLCQGTMQHEVTSMQSQAVLGSAGFKHWESALLLG